jgi:DNA anti-recombination protein RmuC
MSNKFKVVDEHCKKLENQLQNHHLEWQESMAESKERWLEQGTKIEQLVMQMELLSTQFQHFLASQITRKETGLSNNGYEKNLSHIPQCPIAME